MDGLLTMVARCMASSSTVEVALLAHELSCATAGENKYRYDDDMNMQELQASVREWADSFGLAWRTPLVPRFSLSRPVRSMDRTSDF